MLGNGCIAPPFYTSAPDGVESSTSRPCSFNPSETAHDTHWTGGWMDHEPVRKLWGRENLLALTEDWTLAVQLLARSTDWAIYVLTQWNILYKNAGNIFLSFEHTLPNDAAINTRCKLHKKVVHATLLSNECYAGKSQSLMKFKLCAQKAVHWDNQCTYQITAQPTVHVSCSWPFADVPSILCLFKRRFRNRFSISDPSLWLWVNKQKLWFLISHLLFNDNSIQFKLPRNC